MATLTDREYDAELHKLHDQLLLMGAKVEEMIAGSMRALVERDSELARRMIDFDHQINRLEVDTDELCLRILAKRQPVASDLRFVTMALKFVVDVERIGDLAANIAKRALELNRLSPLDARADLPRLAAMVQKNLSLAIQSFVRGDAEQATEVIRADMAVDRLNARLFAQLIAQVVADPATVTCILPLTSVSRYLERIGDHVKNLAEEVIFMVSATDVRHRPVTMTN